MWFRYVSRTPPIHSQGKQFNLLALLCVMFSCVFVHPTAPSGRATEQILYSNKTSVKSGPAFSRDRTYSVYRTCFKKEKKKFGFELPVSGPPYTLALAIIVWYVHNGNEHAQNHYLTERCVRYYTRNVWHV